MQLEWNNEKRTLFLIKVGPLCMIKGLVINHLSGQPKRLRRSSLKPVNRNDLFMNPPERSLREDHGHSGTLLCLFTYGREPG